MRGAGFDVFFHMFVLLNCPSIWEPQIRFACFDVATSEGAWVCLLHSCLAFVDTLEARSLQKLRHWLLEERYMHVYVYHVCYFHFYHDGVWVAQLTLADFTDFTWCYYYIPNQLIIYCYIVCTWFFFVNFVNHWLTQSFSSTVLSRFESRDRKQILQIKQHLRAD